MAVPSPLPNLNQVAGSPARNSIDPGNDIEAASTHPSAKSHHRNAFVPGFNSRPPFLLWLRHNWLDIATQLLCLLSALLIYTFAPPILPRYFPLYAGIERSSWGMKYGQPYITEYINTTVSAVVSFVAPLLVMGAIGLWGTRDFADGNAAIIGLGYALATATIFNSFLKIFIGGLRPHFLSLCAPSMIPPAFPGMPTQGPSYYTASQVCTADAKKIKEAEMSFPSGHASAAFAGFGFLALYLNAKYKVFGQGRRSGFPDPSTAADGTNETGSSAVEEKQRIEQRQRGRIQHWKLVMFAAPWLVAFLIAGSKIRDGWHHPVDIIFGALVGTTFAHLAFRMVYRSVYDWRDNHIPMER